MEWMLFSEWPFKLLQVLENLKKQFQYKAKIEILKSRGAMTLVWFPGQFQLLKP